MPSQPAPDFAASLPGLGWARRVVRQQLDVLSRLTATAWGLLAPRPAIAPHPGSAIWAGVRGLEKAVRLQVRVEWALRLIAALRRRLQAELEAIDNGRPPAPLVAARGLAAESEPADAPDPKERAERPERERLRDYERFSFQGRGADEKLAEILKLPTVEVIALICRELGLPADWPRLAEETWAREEVDEDRTGPRRLPSTGTAPHPSGIIAAPS